MFDVGRVCVKLAGRDAGQKCVVVDVLEGKYVMIDGMTRRKKCNTLHLEPMDQVLELRKNASHEDVVKAFKELGLEVGTKKSKSKQERTKPVRKSLENAKAKVAKKEAAVKKKADKKDKKPAEKKEKPVKPAKEKK